MKRLLGPANLPGGAAGKVVAKLLAQMSTLLQVPETAGERPLSLAGHTCRMRRYRGADLAYLESMPAAQADARRFVHQADLAAIGAAMDRQDYDLLGRDFCVICFRGLDIRNAGR